MTALKVIGVILLIFLLIGFLRVGGVVLFGDELCVKLRVGHICLTVFPRGKKKKKKEKPKAEKPKEEKTEAEAKPKTKHAFPKPTVEDLLDLVQTALSALGAMVRRACKRVRIDPLDVTVVFGGTDPAAVATSYGAASAVIFAQMPKLEERFYIPNPSLHLRMDFDAAGTTAKGQVGVSLRISDLFAIVFTLLIPLAKWFLRFKRAHRHDKAAHRGALASESKQTEIIDTEDKIA